MEFDTFKVLDPGEQLEKKEEYQYVPIHMTLT